MDLWEPWGSNPLGRPGPEPVPGPRCPRTPVSPDSLLLVIPPTPMDNTPGNIWAGENPLVMR
jgi:hypothetical protein